MADIAEIAFRADTGDLDDAVTKLNAIRPAAAGAATAANNLSNIVEGASLSIYQAAVKAAQAEKTKADAVLASSQASTTASQADIEAAAASSKQAAASLLVAKAERDKQTAVMATAAAMEKVTAATEAATAAAAQNAAGGKTPGSPAANGNSPVSRFNTGNIAAQFQDIGVTAAMGMNPLTIALQQGTQLSAVLNTMEKPLQGIKAAFTEILNPISLTTIAVVALAAGALELVNWVTVAKTVLHDLASALVAVAPYVLEVSATLALMYAPALITGLGVVIATIFEMGAAATVAGAQMAAAWIVGMGPIGWIVLAIAAVTVAANAFRDDLASIFGNDIVGSAKTALNQIIGFFVGAFQGIVAAWDDLSFGLNGVTSKSGQELGTVFGDAFSKAMGKDYIAKATAAISAGAASAAAAINKYADTIGNKKPKHHAKTDEEKYDDVVSGADRKLASMQAANDTIGQSAEATAILKYQTDLLNDAQQKNITLTDAGRTELMGLGAQMGVLSTQTKQTQDALKFVDQAAQGAFTTMRQGLEQGKGLWASFGSAVQGILNDLIDTLAKTQIKGFFGSIAAGGAGPGAASLFTSLGKMLANKNGNAFDSGGVTAFAKGGSFTNTIVNRATPFAFANGGALGVMGEAGPEAIMPLHRGADGSLGVKMNGGGSSAPVIVNVNNNSNATASVNQKTNSGGGVEIDVIIDQVVSTKLGQQGSMSNRALRSFNSQAIIQR